MYYICRNTYVADTCVIQMFYICNTPKTPHMYYMHGITNHVSYPITFWTPNFTIFCFNPAPCWGSHTVIPPYQQVIPTSYKSLLNEI